MAITSLVLSIVWLFGVGSLLAIIFGAVARRQIRSSRNLQSGAGLALAGIIIGVVGVVGLGGSIALGVTYLSPSTTRLQYGQTASFPLLSTANTNGVASMTVQSPIGPTSSSTHPGTAVVGATVGMCATSRGMQHTPLTFEFTLLLQAGQTVSGAIDYTTPLSSAVTELGPSKCGLGFVDFTVPTTARPESVEYHIAFPDRTYIWK